MMEKGSLDLQHGLGVIICLGGGSLVAVVQQYMFAAGRRSPYWAGELLFQYNNS
jgi:hypothetical protein